MAQERNIPLLGKAAWVGSKYGSFERVQLAFNAAGFTEPDPDNTDQGPGSGAYVMNIIEQYDLTERQVLAIVNYAVRHKKEYLASGPIPLSSMLIQYEYLREQKER